MSVLFRRRTQQASLAVFSICASYVSAGAEEPAALSQVIIQGHQIEESLPQELAELGNRVDVITNDSIRKGAYLDASAALQALAPGLYIQPKNGPFDYVNLSLLGSRTEDVLWLIDGIRVNNRLYSGTTPTDTLPASMVDRIEVLEGGQSLFYGTAALAGAVNIVTRPFTDVLKAGVDVGADSHWGRHLDGYLSDGWGPQKLVLYGSLDKSDGYRAFRLEDYQPSSTDRKRGYTIWTGGIKYAFDVTEQLRLSASYQRTNANLDYALPARVFRDVNSRREDLASLKVDFALNERVGFYIKSYYHRWHTTYDTFYNDLQNPGTLDVLYDGAVWGYDDYGVNALSQVEIAKGVEGLLGYDLQVYGGRDEVLYIAPNKEHTHAVFGQLRTTPDLLPQSHLAAGFRFNAPDVGAHSTVWNVSGQYDLRQDLFVKATLGTNFRLPSAEELFANDPLDERGNPNLRPERSRSVNLSVGGEEKVADAHFTWELIGFARDIRDLIDYGSFDEDTGQEVFDNVPGTVKVRGGEIALSASVSDIWAVQASFEANSSKLEGGDQLTRVPRQVGKAQIDFHPPAARFGATLSFNYTGSVDAPVGADRVPYGRFAVVDLSGRYFLDPEHKQRITLAVQNLLDRQYGTPGRGCRDVASDGPYDCSAPYVYLNRSLPRTLALHYSYDF